MYTPTKSNLPCQLTQTQYLPELSGHCSSSKYYRVRTEHRAKHREIYGGGGDRDLHNVRISGNFRD